MPYIQGRPTHEFGSLSYQNCKAHVPYMNTTMSQNVYYVKNEKSTSLAGQKPMFLTSIAESNITIIGSTKGPKKKNKIW